MSLHARLFARLAIALLVVSCATDGIMLLFAPRWLLLDDATVQAGTSAALACIGAAAFLDVVALAVLLAPLRGVLRALDLVTEQLIAPADLVELDAAPARLAVVHVCVAATVAAVAQLDGVRPSGGDQTTLAALAVLAFTLVSTASLPLYVTARAIVAGVVERAPTSVAREAVSIVSSSARRVARVRLRFLAAVAAPVSLVAMGATLLVFAHTRSFETVARGDDARAVVAGTLDSVSGSVAGRGSALSSAASLGLPIAFEPASSLAAATHDPSATATVTLADGRAVIQLHPATVGAATATGAVVTLVAVLLAALIGRQIGLGLSRDVALANIEINSMGALDAFRGERAIAGAHFDVVQQLARALDRLGGVFQQFAMAQQRAIEARAQVERSRSTFLASMSHDLRSPLNSILGFATLAGQSAKLLPLQRESVAIVESRGRELLELIETVLDSALAEAGRLEIAREPTPPVTIVRESVQAARAILAATQVEIMGEAQQDAAPVNVDGRRLVQALVAITTTAARACEQGVVRVRVTSAREALVIEVTVLGAGASGSARLAEALAAPERARRLGSLGLGLVLARAIAGLHGGVLTFDPAAPSITMSLPLTSGDGSW